MQCTRSILVLITLLISFDGHASAQRTTATFAGIVADSSGAVLPGAEVQLINEGTSATVQQVTGETGEFLFDYVPAGTYISLGKSFSIREEKKLELKADMLNAFNHTNYSAGTAQVPAISTDMNSITFGQATGTDPARTIQLQLRLTF
jgi:hypothetical protein